jgi:hypothetical protein
LSHHVSRIGCRTRKQHGGALMKRKEQILKQFQSRQTVQCINLHISQLKDITSLAMLLKALIYCSAILKLAACKANDNDDSFLLFHNKTQ